MKLTERDSSTEWLFGKDSGIRNAIKANLSSANADGHRNRARRRVAHLHRFQTIRTRIVDYGPPHIYYFFNSCHKPNGFLDIPGGPPVTNATDGRIFFVGDVVEVDLNYNKGGWGKIVRLVSSENRTHDATWDFKPDDDLFARFPVPPGPLPDATPVVNRLWKNNSGAQLQVEFTPAHWGTFPSARLNGPSLRFRRAEITSDDPFYQTPGGYMHDGGLIPFVVPNSTIHLQDSFTRSIDEYFVARLWAGKQRPVFGSLALPGIGATLQTLYFTRAPHEILGEKFYYA